MIGFVHFGCTKSQQAEQSCPVQSRKFEFRTGPISQDAGPVSFWRASNRLNAVAAKRLDGVATAAAIRSELAPRVAAFRARAGRAPALHIVLVGDDPASQVYVRNKERAGREAGLEVTLHRIPATTTRDELLAAVRGLNADPGCDGILVQSPLPKSLGKEVEQEVFDAIDPAKDVDCFHPANVGRLAAARCSLHARLRV